MGLNYFSVILVNIPKRNLYHYYFYYFLGENVDFESRINQFRALLKQYFGLEGHIPCIDSNTRNYLKFWEKFVIAENYSLNC